MKEGSQYDTKSHGRITVEKYINNTNVLVSFEDGAKAICSKQRILDGSVSNPNYKYGLEIGQVFHNKNYGNTYVVESITDSKTIGIVFPNTGNKLIATVVNVKGCRIKDVLEPSIAGVGYIGKGKHKSRHERKDVPAYKAWNDMIQRCYNKDSHSYSSYGAIGVTVCKEWHNYQNYADWYVENFIEGCVLDKDLTSWNSKRYSPKTCTFITPEMNGTYISMYYKFPTGTNVLNLTEQQRQEHKK